MFGLFVVVLGNMIFHELLVTVAGLAESGLQCYRSFMATSSTTTTVEKETGTGKRYWPILNLMPTLGSQHLFTPSLDVFFSALVPLLLLFIIELPLGINANGIL